MPVVYPEDRDYNFWVLLNQVLTLMSYARDAELTKYGTSTMQAAILFIVNQLGGAATPSQISSWVVRRPAAISGIVDRMQRAGLVEKVKDLPRRNWIRIRLTEKGQKVFEQSLKRTSIRQVLSGLSEEEREQIISILIKLRKKAAKVLGRKQKIPYPYAAEDDRKSQDSFKGESAN